MRGIERRTLVWAIAILLLIGLVGWAWRHREAVPFVTQPLVATATPFEYGTARVAQEVLGGDCLTLGGDLGDIDSIGSIFAQLEERWGGLDILVNNAAVMVRTPLLEIEPAQSDKIMNTNLRGAFFCAQAAARLMMRQGGGVIVNTSSNAARMPIYGAGVYAMAKGGMNTMTMALAGELAPYNIRVNGYMPGLIVTEQSMSSKDAANEAERLKPVALRRYGTVEEMADVVLFLASPMSSYMTGETVTANGGKLAIQNPWKGWESK